MQRVELIQRAVGGDVTIGRLIGTGGFADVYEGNDERLGRRVAIKVLREEMAAPRARERFIREARAAAQIRHPNVLAVYDVGERDGIVWFSMPMVMGESLRARLDRERRLDPDEAVRILGAAAAGLHAAHRGGLVHRDVKPDNILLDGPERHVLIADFGVAAAVVPDGERITTEGAVIGTPRYMSPEQAAGEPTIDARSDVYSLGVVAYEMLAGEPPFAAANAAALMAKHLTAQVPPLRNRVPACPSRISTAIERALEKDPADRWPTADAFRQAIEGRVSGAISTTGTFEVPVPQSRPLFRDLPLIAASLVAVALLAIDVGSRRILLAPVAVLLAFIVVAVRLGARAAARSQQPPAAARGVDSARRLRRARALRTAGRALLASMPKAERARLAEAELGLDRLLFAADQASASGDTNSLEQVVGALAELHSAVESAASGDSGAAVARAHDVMARVSELRTGRA